MKHALLLVTLGMIVLLGAGVGYTWLVQRSVFAAGVTFQDEDLLAQSIDKNPRAALEALKSIITQEEADAFYAAMIPAPTTDQKIDYLRLAYREAVRAGESSLAADLKARIEALGGTVARGSNP